MNITVVRGTGEKSAPAISDRLLTTVEAGIERGRVEIDSQFYDRDTVDTSLVDFNLIDNGSFISCDDTMPDNICLLIGISAEYAADQPPKITITTERVIL